MSADPRVLASEVLIVGFQGRHAPEELVQLTRAGALGGIILFKRNLGTPVEVARLVASFPVHDERPAMVAVDQEGGRVARLGAPLLRLPPMRALAATGDEALVRDAATLLGKQLRALGFTMDFAPVLDVDTNPANPVIGDRSFGTTPDVVSRFALAFADGLERAGVASCGKHFPGHGDTAQDSHFDLPRLPHGRARLDAVELPPFVASRGRVPALMTAHVVFEAIDATVPATLSPAVMTKLLREELGWDGLTISDDLEMKAVADHVGAVRASSLAIRAGCDALLVCSDVALALAVRDHLAAEAESDPAFLDRLRDAVERGRRLRRKYRATPVTDEAALSAALDPEATAALERRISLALEREPSA